MYRVSIHGKLLYNRRKRQGFLSNFDLNLANKIERLSKIAAKVFVAISSDIRKDSKLPFIFLRNYTRTSNVSLVIHGS